MKGSGIMAETNTKAFKDQVQAEIDYIRPLLQADGGDIELVTADEPTGKVSVRLQGACSGCPGAAMTLKNGVERILKKSIPEVKSVENVG